MEKTKSPCLNCKERVAVPNCHSTCEKYIDFQEYKKMIIRSRNAYVKDVDAGFRSKRKRSKYNG